MNSLEKNVGAPGKAGGGSDEQSGGGRGKDVLNLHRL